MMMSIQLDLVGIVVADMGRALAFYRTLGLEIPAHADTEAHVEVNEDGVRLAFDTVDVATSVYGDWGPASGHRIERAFRCASREDVDSRYETLMAAGYTGHRAPWDAFWGQRYAIVCDPDGNRISLFAA